jgi:DNA modification methylase
MTIKILQGDTRQVLTTLPDASVHCCVTSPPYFGLRDYGMPEQIGLEQTPADFIEQLVLVFREVRRVLRDDGTLWLNIGDSYANDTKWGGATSGKHAQAVHGATGIGRRRTATGYKSKELMGIPWQLAFALSADGWYLRQDIIWHKPNVMPESVTDRCTKSHEYLFLLSKAERYWFDADAIAEPVVSSAADLARARVTGRGEQASSAAYLGSAQRDKSGGFPVKDLDNPKRNRRSVWTINTRPFKGAHFATMAPTLAETCIKAGCPIGGTVLDPFGGAGTTGVVAATLDRHATLIELNPEYVDIARNRIAADAPLFAEVA